MSNPGSGGFPLRSGFLRQIRSPVTRAATLRRPLRSAAARRAVTGGVEQFYLPLPAFLAADALDLDAGQSLTAYSASWSQKTGLLSGKALNGGLYPNYLVGADDDSIAAYTGTTAPNDQWAQCRVWLPPAGGGAIGPAVRVSATGTCYAVNVGPGGTIALVSYLNGVYVGGFHGSSSPFDSGDHLRIEAEGTTIRVKRNGVTVITHTDALSITSGQWGVTGYQSNPDVWITDWMAGSLSSGTTFTQAVGGVITAVGGLVKQTNKRLLASATPAGLLAKLISKFPAGSVTAAGAVSKETRKSPSGSITGSGGLQRQANKAVAGSITGAGALQRQTNKRSEGSLTLSGLLAKLTSRTLGGSTAPTGEVRKLTVKAALTGSITGSGALASAAVLSQAIAGSITAVGALAKTTLKAAAGSIGLTGALTKLTQKALSGNLTPQGRLSRLTSRLVSGSITPAGALTRGFRAFKSLAGSITGAGSLAALFQAGGGGPSTIARWFNKLVINVRRHRRRR